ncbi:ribonuclease T2 [Suhomyces tanzawaensis NRRL Y-17324]|uniref:Ribonuclease T2-like n=1 Tax=Suhomyces tanzawaensis NRRL Y-17324 TaxID=984487 RepID=A0A1E4SGV8_9ASCO|nr:ribonuclease T2 [Suhomyces tanzawaensis NRRL Y-17324]ODV78705.1 ribonuclease T2 [Suhomyces tanzawaensis NRRL Y-17324]
MLADSTLAFPQQLLKLGNTFVSKDSAPSCPVDSPISCSISNADAQNSCCYESPGGILLQTQFWDYSPAVGADDAFTLHGLWPDNCDGTYAQFCDSSLNLKGDVKSIIVDQYKDQALYDLMVANWKNYNGNDESLWEHEYNKHGTCIRTLNPKCLGDAASNQNIYQFYKITEALYSKLPTYKFLTDAGIHPDPSATYTKKQIADALSAGFGGKNVYFKCDNKNALQEVWYFHHLRGSILGEDFIQIDSLQGSRCPDSGIKWIPKSKSNPGDGGNPSNPSNPNPPLDAVASGYLKLTNNPGCLISAGNWYSTGTCATYRVQESQFGGYNLKTSKGFCGFDQNNDFACGSQYQASKYQFQYDSSSGQISYGGKSDWCYDKRNSHGGGNQLQIPVKLDDGNCGTTFKLYIK